MIKISGIQPISNGVSLGFPFIEAILSVLPIVDEFLINDGGSSDNTSFYLKKLQKTFPNKIRLFNRPFYPSECWETIDDCIEFLISKAKGNWIFEVQGDEIWHEKDLLRLQKTIKKADKENYNSIRTACYYGSGFDLPENTYKYMNVRIVRKLDNIKSYFGGDDFHIGNNRKLVIGFTTSNVPPEIIIRDTSCHNIGYDSFPENATKRTKITSDFFTRKQPERKDIYQEVLNRGYLRDSNMNKQDIKIFPALAQGLINLRKYKVRDKLFNKKNLANLTGLKYL